jgi:hypothetical protein
MKEYDKFPKAAKEKIIERRNEKLIAEEQEQMMSRERAYYGGYIAALNWLME